MDKIAFHAMGCEMMAALDAPQPGAARRLADAPGWFEDWEAALSRFRPESELSRLNRRPCEPQPVSPVLWQVFQAARWAYQWTGGLVTPAVLPALQAAGYDRSFERLPQDGGQSLRSLISSPACRVPGLEEVSMDYDHCTLTLPAGLSLDFGGIAKGWAATQAAQRLGHYRPALVDAGGDIAASGLRQGGEPWPVAIVDPLHPEQDLVLLKLRRGGVATSGRDYRRWRQGGEDRHHLIDPRTGRPAETDVLAASVIAADLLMAEAAAKVLLILGSREGLAWLARRPGLAGLVVLENGDWIGSQNLEHHVWQ